MSGGLIARGNALDTEAVEGLLAECLKDLGAQGIAALVCQRAQGAKRIRGEG